MLVRNVVDCTIERIQADSQRKARKKKKKKKDKQIDVHVSFLYMKYGFTKIGEKIL